MLSKTQAYQLVCLYYYQTNFNDKFLANHFKLFATTMNSSINQKVHKTNPI